MSSSSDAAPTGKRLCFLCESNTGYIHYEAANTEENRAWQKRNMPGAYHGKIFKKPADNDTLTMVICQQCSDAEDAKLAEYQSMIDRDDAAKAEEDEMARAMAKSRAMANEAEMQDMAEEEEMARAIAESLAMATQD